MIFVLGRHPYYPKISKYSQKTNQKKESNKPFAKKNQATGLQNKSSPKNILQETIHKTSLHQKKIPVQVFSGIASPENQRSLENGRCSRKICGLYMFKISEIIRKPQINTHIFSIFWLARKSHSLSINVSKTCLIHGP